MKHAQVIRLAQALIRIEQKLDSPAFAIGPGTCKLCQRPSTVVVKDNIPILECGCEVRVHPIDEDWLASLNDGGQNERRRKRSKVDEETPDGTG